MQTKPILFKAHEVRAILSGSQTQMRRVVKPPHLMFFNQGAGDMLGQWDKRPLPYGLPGDQLWVRESFSGPYFEHKTPPRDWLDIDPIWYWADGDPEYGDWTKPKPGIHMPRWASRVTLEITGVRVERLQDISEADAIAEGVFAGDYEYDNGEGTESAKESYKRLWESINGAGSWDANPWVWVVEFKQV